MGMGVSILSYYCTTYRSNGGEKCKHIHAHVPIPTVGFSSVFIGRKSTAPRCGYFLLSKYGYLVHLYFILFRDSPYLYSRLMTSPKNSLSSNFLVTSKRLNNVVVVNMGGVNEIDSKSSQGLSRKRWSVLLNLHALSSNYWSPSYYYSSGGTGGRTQPVTPLNSPGRAFTEPSSDFSNYNHLIVKTSSLLVKREDFYRNYLRSKGYAFFLPKDFRSTPNNTFLTLLKSNFAFPDRNLTTNEVSRGFLNQKPGNTNAIAAYFSHSTRLNYLYNLTHYTSTKSSENIQKNQYRPMRKGITSMVRLHATGAVAVPTEIRVHILASSKDVIHSWAIPSAGIKIDCIPGYSSHRVTIFFNSGTYWGQCMEICGRFHHWMPIVLYIMKRDAFFIWVTHFIYYDKNLGIYQNTSKINSTMSSLGPSRGLIWDITPPARRL